MPETQKECIACRRLGADFDCSICFEHVCKKCVQKLSDETFAYLPKVPENLSHIYYCGACYDLEVQPVLTQYEEILGRAKNAFIFFKTQRKEIPLIKKSKELLSVEGRPDRDETILRLAYMAAELGFNAVIDVDAVSKKLRNHAYQKHEWQGSGYAAQVDEEKIARQDRQNQIYR